MKPTVKPIGSFPAIDIAANVAIANLSTDKFTFSNAKGALEVSNGVLTLKSFNVGAFAGIIQTKGTLDLRDSGKRAFNLDLDIKNVESNTLLSNFTSLGRYLFGTFSTRSSLRGELDDSMGLNPRSLLGSGTVQISNGKLKGFPLMQKLAEFTNLTTLKEVDFAEWTNVFSISDGRINIKEGKVTTGAGEFQIGGSQGGFDGRCRASRSCRGSPP